MMTLKVPIISIVIGEGGSGGALALAVADRVWMLENSIYSVISPEGCASILWKDATKVREASECLKLTADDLLKLEIIEKIIPEFSGNQERVYEVLNENLHKELSVLNSMSEEEMLQARYDRFRKF